jgi:hypothetical protein
VAAPTHDLKQTKSFELSGFGASTCAGIEVGRDGQLYVLSYDTREMLVVTRDGSELLRKVDLSGIIDYPDGIVAVPGGFNFLITDSGPLKHSAIIDPNGNVVVPPAPIGAPDAPLTGGTYQQAFDGMLAICSTGQIWACDELGSECHGFIPANGEVDTCGCVVEE